MWTLQALIKNNLWYSLLRKKRVVKSIIIDISGGVNMHAYVACIWIKYHWKDIPEISNINCTKFLENWSGERFFTLLYLLNFKPCKYTTYSKTKTTLCFNSLRAQSLEKEDDRHRGCCKGVCWAGVVPRSMEVHICPLPSIEREVICCEEEHVPNIDIV